MRILEEILTRNSTAIPRESPKKLMEQSVHAHRSVPDIRSDIVHIRILRFVVQLKLVLHSLGFSCLHEKPYLNIFILANCNTVCFNSYHASSLDLDWLTSGVECPGDPGRTAAMKTMKL